MMPAIPNEMKRKRKIVPKTYILIFRMTAAVRWVLVVGAMRAVVLRRVNVTNNEWGIREEQKKNEIVVAELCTI